MLRDFNLFPQVDLLITMERKYGDALTYEDINGFKKKKKKKQALKPGQNGVASEGIQGMTNTVNSADDEETGSIKKTIASTAMITQDSKEKVQLAVKKA